MKREVVLKKLRGHRLELQRMGVKALSRFGSAARDQSTQSSDVDLLVEHERPVGLLEFVRIQLRLDELLDGATVDLVPGSALRQEFRPRVSKDLIRAI